jgi:hypothetical protein
MGPAGDGGPLLICGPAHLDGAGGLGGRCAKSFCVAKRHLRQRMGNGLMTSSPSRVTML